MSIDTKTFKNGMKASLPIAFAYFTVAFSLGIIAKEAGLNVFEGMLTSATLNASAGEYIAFNSIKADYSYLEAFLLTIVANARYILMSFSLAQKLNPQMSIKHRILLGYFLTDEYFSLSISQEGYVNPYYAYGAISIATPAWAIGTGLGIILGNILPVKIVKALSIALYCMFIAIIVPAAKKDNKVLYAIIVSFVLSYIGSFIKISQGIVTIILTILISSLFALIFPRSENES